MNAHERLAESDDAVRAELPPELLPAWERVRRTMRATGYASRVECFLDWCHDHPGEVARYYREAIDRSARRLARSEPQPDPVDAGDPSDELARAFHEAWLAEPSAPSVPVQSARAACATAYAYPTIPPF